MELKDFKDKCFGVADYWEELMPIMAMEEAAEFQQAVSKCVRAIKKIDDSGYIEQDEFEDYLDTRYHLASEMADLYIAMEALKKPFAIPDSLIENYISEKLNKKY